MAAAQLAVLGGDATGAGRDRRVGWPGCRGGRHRRGDRHAALRAAQLVQQHRGPGPGGALGQLRRGAALPGAEQRHRGPARGGRRGRGRSRGRGDRARAQLPRLGQLRAAPPGHPDLRRRRPGHLHPRPGRAGPGDHARAPRRSSWCTCTGCPPTWTPILAFARQARAGRHRGRRAGARRDLPRPPGRFDRPRSARSASWRARTWPPRARAACSPPTTRSCATGPTR